VDGDDLTQRARVPDEMAAPIGVADDHGSIVTRLCLLVAKESAQSRWNMEYVEKLRTYLSGLRVLSRAADGRWRLASAVVGQGLEREVLGLPIFEIGDRNLTDVSCALTSRVRERYDPVGVGEGERLQ